MIFKKINISKIFILIVIILIFNCFNNKELSYDYKIILDINPLDVLILKKRLVMMKLNEFKILKNNEKYEVYFNKTKLIKNKNITDNFFDLLITNHYYEVYFTFNDYLDEIRDYIKSNFKINLKPINSQPVLTGNDIDKVFINDNKIEVYYNKNGKLKYEKALMEKDKIEVTFLDKQFWSYGRIYSNINPELTAHPYSDLLVNFQKIGKSYSDIDLKVITIFSGLNFNYPIELVGKYYRQ